MITNSIEFSWMIYENQKKSPSNKSVYIYYVNVSYQQINNLDLEKYSKKKKIYNSKLNKYEKYFPTPIIWDEHWSAYLDKRTIRSETSMLSHLEVKVPKKGAVHGNLQNLKDGLHTETMFR